MRNFRTHFEGWYFKHRIGDRVFAAIPGMSVNASGEASAFVQVIGNGGSQVVPFPIGAYRAQAAPLLVEVGENWFTAEGMHLQLPNLRAELRYGPLTPLSGGEIMGPFGKVPLMECYHGIDSLLHTVDGSVEWDGARTRFEGGSGYIERDWGRSFPKRWVWLECHGFKGRPGDSIMLAIAEIPLCGLRFTGILCVCRVEGVQHRLATYRGARLVAQRMEDGQYRAALRQGRYRLDVEVRFGDGGALQAPVMGAMSRVITEYPSCEVRVRFMEGERVLMDGVGEGCGFERVQ